MFGADFVEGKNYFDLLGMDPGCRHHPCLKEFFTKLRYV